MQVRAVTTILAGYNENDAEQVEAGLSSVAVRELDLDLAKLAREVPRPAAQEGETGGLC